MTELERLQAIRLQPGDTILITVPGSITRGHANILRDEVEAKFPGYPVLIVSGAELSILHDQEAG